MEEHKKRNGLSSHISLGHNSHDTKNILVGTTPEITTLETKPSNQGPNHSILFTLSLAFLLLLGSLGGFDSVS